MVSNSKLYTNHCVFCLILANIEFITSGIKLPIFFKWWSVLWI